MRKQTCLVGIMALAMLVSACGAGPAPEGLTPATMILDWVPNTNHTGLFVAQSRGFFAEEGLAVEIIQPGEVYAEQAVAGGVADFGISFQEQVTLARADGVPIVSIAAVIQHNTSGFASLSEAGAASPSGWEGLTYGSFGSPFEEPTLQELMACDGGDFAALEIVDTGFADPLALLDEEQIDLAWIFIGWQGIQADLQDIPLKVIAMEDWFECIPDYYTPVIIASETTIEERPELVRSFLRAASRGYEFAIDDPAAAAAILLEEVPELDGDLVRASQAWLSERYQAEAPRWGEQDLQTWAGYAAWMEAQGILARPVDPARAFTTEFLPNGE
jgi:ABC-type nitrate/sulfonate/bicarbonate transport system substrate-binding protein